MNIIATTLFVHLGAIACQDSYPTTEFDSISAVTTLPTPSRSHPVVPIEGVAVVEFGVSDAGKPISIRVECESTPGAGDHIAGYVSRMRFKVPTPADTHFRLALRLEFDGDRIELTDLHSPKP